MREQKVAEIASAVVYAYLNAAGFNYGIERRPNYPGFEGYWAAHKGRSYSGSWFVVQINRVDADLKTIREEIAALPVPDRQWELLWVATRHLYSGEEQTPVVSEADLLEACRQLGRELSLVGNWGSTARPSARG
jgi:hypothetical protein